MNDRKYGRLERVKRTPFLIKQDDTLRDCYYYYDPYQEDRPNPLVSFYTDKRRISKTEVIYLIKVPFLYNDVLIDKSETPTVIILFNNAETIIYSDKDTPIEQENELTSAINEIYKDMNKLS